MAANASDSTSSSLNLKLQTDSDPDDFSLIDCQSSSTAPVPSPGLFRLGATASTMTEADLRRLSPTALAYLGDAVYELYIRCHYIWPPGRLNTCHQKVVAAVNAIAQAEQIQGIESQLTPQEQDILRRGRNAAPRRKSAGDAKAYQQATGFETLIGYLYLTDPQRLQTILGYLTLPPVDTTAPGSAE